MSKKSRPQPLFIFCGIVFITFVSTITGVAIGRSINNNVISQNGRSSSNPTQVIQPSIPTPIAQEPTQVQPIPIAENSSVAVTQEPAQVQPVDPPATFPVETPLQAEQNLRTQTGKCINPDDLDSRGRRCGRRSAYNKGSTTGYDSNR